MGLTRMFSLIERVYYCPVGAESAWSATANVEVALVEALILKRNFKRTGMEWDVWYSIGCKSGVSSECHWTTVYREGKVLTLK